MKSIYCRLLLCLGTVLLHSTLAVPAARAASLSWSATSGNWSVGANWGGTPPTSADDANITNGGTASLVTSDSAAVCNTLTLGAATNLIQMPGGNLTSINYEYLGGNAAGTGTFNQTGGTHNAYSVYVYGRYQLGGLGLLSLYDEEIGSSGSASFIQSGGTNLVTFDPSENNGNLILGANAGDIGSYNLSGTGALVSPYEYIGSGFGFAATGSFTQSGGTNTLTAPASGFTENSSLFLGYDLHSAGSYLLSGSGLLTANGELVAGYGSAVFHQTGGTNSNAGSLYIGYYHGSSGTYSLASGSLSANSEYIGYSGGAGLFSQSGGTNTVATTFQLGGGTYSLTAGELVVPNIQGGGELDFGGGTLAANAAFVTTQPISLTGSGAIAYVAPQGNVIGFSGTLAGPGALDLIGSGELVLSGTNKYTGGTIVSGGTLVIANSFSIQGGTKLIVGNVAAFSAPAAPMVVMPVPEPGSLAILAVTLFALGVLVMLRRNRSRRGQQGGAPLVTNHHIEARQGL